ncbi:Restriction endonuclease [Rubrivivax sp. A210]|uniref:restriction endonuclease n=1 Tax=Rubrivivax sp. A210 TaxID=2772301 RepID=UPI00191B6C25|nr:restriction endonuclease [Rubrivivax sp. A210]CAD5366578.1 Restriction endonuclease [Rubrivivax sp. A210]
MARRGKTSPAEDVVELVSRLPWWAGVVLALVTYLFFHAVASRPAAVSISPGQLGPSMVSIMWVGLATGLQYVAPLLCLIAAAVSAYRRRERAGLLEAAKRGQSASVLNGISWQQFEQLVGEAFRQQGYGVVESGGQGPDGGVDLVLTKGGEKFLVQCKQWRAFKVGVEVVREIYGVMAARGAAGGFVVTSGQFTDEAKAFASGRNVTLIDGPKLHRMIQSAQAGPAGAAGPARRPASPAFAEPPAQPARTPACPKCGKAMVQRTARKGAAAGSDFWGCGDFPDCRGTRPLAG